MKDISNCKEKQECNEFCHRYSHTRLPPIFIGNIEHLEEIHDFLRKNPVSTDGFLEEEPEEEEQQDEKKIQNQEESEKKDFFAENPEENSNNDLDNSVWDFYKSTFELHKKRLIKKKMSKIKMRVNKDFDERAIH